jgi:hypothetical protein
LVQGALEENVVDILQLRAQFAGAIRGAMALEELFSRGQPPFGQLPNEDPNFEGDIQ